MMQVYEKAHKAWSIYRNDGIEGIKNKLEERKNNKEIIKKYGISLNQNCAVPYNSEYQNNIIFSDKNSTDIKPLAFYLPQYHTFPENDKWWGKGFTEWTNTSKANPRFEGHYQPRIPHKDFGYYDLSNVEVIRKQVELAKQHGIYGFCFYYYWFSGKRLMEKPVDLFLENKDIDFPFCLCWANENWTRTWDGLNNNILIKQDYTDDDDNRFIVDIQKYITDSRYIKVNGKPLIIVYNPGIMKDCRKSFTRWRKVAKKLGIGQIEIWTVQTFNTGTANDNGIGDCIDGEVEFPPHGYGFSEIKVPNKALKVKKNDGYIFDYDGLVNLLEYKNRIDQKSMRNVPIYRTCMMAWDNSCRREKGWNVFYHYSIRSFYKWVRFIVDDTRKMHDKNNRFIFVNAWNEWAEGTYLEPDEKYGYANINTFSRAIYDLPFDDASLKIFDDKNDKKIVHKFVDDKNHSRIAIQAHIFYPELADEIIENFNYIPYKFDCYISTDSEEKAQILRNKFRKKCKAEKVSVEVFKNRGRDVAPFLKQLMPVVDQYDYICHIHSKMTKTRGYGNTWRKYLYHHLFGSQNYMYQLFDYFEENPDIGIIFPENYPLLSEQLVWSVNFENCCKLLKSMNINMALPDKPLFPAGDMFWARTKAVRKIFKLNIPLEKFSEEAGQIDGTLAHAIERSWVYISRSEGYNTAKVLYMETPVLTHKKYVVIYAHTPDCKCVSNAEMETIEKLCSISQNIYFLSNNKIDDIQVNKLNSLGAKIIYRNNNDFEYGAWKDGIIQVLDDFETNTIDEIILLSSRLVSTIIPLEYMINKMNNTNYDFWGIAIRPNVQHKANGKIVEIPSFMYDHFLAFNKKIIYSDDFISFINNIDYGENYKRAEYEFNHYLQFDLGNKYKYGVFMPETEEMCSLVGSNDLVDTNAYGLAVLGSPFILINSLDYCQTANECQLMLVLKPEIKNMWRPC